VSDHLLDDVTLFFEFVSSKLKNNHIKNEITLNEFDADLINILKVTSCRKQSALVFWPVCGITYHNMCRIDGLVFIGSI